MKERIVKCRPCGEEFVSTRKANGKWVRTCSVECRIVAMRRLAETLIEQADQLERDDLP